MKDTRLGVLVAALVMSGVVGALADLTWLETDDGIGLYDYIEKDSTTYVHYGTDWGSWNCAAVWVFVGDGTGHDYPASHVSGVFPDQDLSSGNLSGGNHGADWAAGEAIDLYCKVDDDGGGGSPTQSSYLNELMILDVQRTDVAGEIYTNGNSLVLQFKIDIGSASGGRTLDRLWVKNNGDLQEGTHIANGALRLYYESGTEDLVYNGTETWKTLWGDWGPSTTSDEQFANETLDIDITAGEGLNCYIVISSYADPAAALAKTAQFEIMLDGMSLDTFGNAAGAGDPRVRMDAEQNANALTASELLDVDNGAVFRIK